MTVQRVDYDAEKAARKAREKQAAKDDGPDALKLSEERVNRTVEEEHSKLTAEERATIDRIWAEAAKRLHPPTGDEELDEHESEQTA